jgi:3-hydroxyisobutyrate dehydrogenase
MSTVGVEWTNRLADLADLHGVAFVDAPVSGSSGPAEKGELEILAGGAGQARPRVEPNFDVLGGRTVWLDRVGDGRRLKLALNNWLIVLVEAMSETLAFSKALGLEPHQFLETIAGGPLASVYAMTKGAAMLDEDFVAGFPLRHAVKDAELAMSAATGTGRNSRSPKPCCLAGVKPSPKAMATTTSPRPLHSRRPPCRARACSWHPRRDCC